SKRLPSRKPMSSCSGSDRRWRIASRSAPWVMNSGTSAPETAAALSDPAGTQWIERATGIGLRNIMKPLWIGELKAPAPLEIQPGNHTTALRTGKSRIIRRRPLPMASSSVDVQKDNEKDSRDGDDRFGTHSRSIGHARGDCQVRL